MNRYFAYYKSKIGFLELVSSDNSIIACNFVEKKNNYENKITILKESIEQLDDYFNGRRMEFDLDISLIGTEFQRKIWNELLKIPYGKSITYKELAIRIGNEKATRAVGNANGKNPLSIIIPCHRVIGSNGLLVGYGGGLERKKWLLEFENKISHQL